MVEQKKLIAEGQRAGRAALLNEITQRESRMADAVKVEVARLTSEPVAMEAKARAVEDAECDLRVHLGKLAAAYRAANTKASGA